MIQDIKIGDIASPSNPAHIIIGMNSTLDDLRRLGITYATQLSGELTHPLVLGSVLSFRFKSGARKLYMIICHHIGYGGWKNAAEYVRFGLDYLKHVSQADEQFSIVDIGTGEIGQRDGADHAAIRTAIATSHLPVTLYVRDDMDQHAPVEKAPLELVAYAAWHPLHGEQRIYMAA